jgi:hypothetical protein
VGRGKYGKREAEEMTKSRADMAVAKLLANAAGLRYGSVSVCIKIHDGRVTETIFTTSENTRDQKPKNEGTENDGHK